MNLFKRVWAAFNPQLSDADLAELTRILAKPEPRRVNRYFDRFTEALTLLCGARPPARLVVSWLNESSEELQAWVLNSPSLPHWAQGIAALDAAHTLADQPEEGRGDIDYSGPFDRWDSWEQALEDAPTEPKRTLNIWKGDELITSIKPSAEPIDVTNDAGENWRTLTNVDSFDVVETRGRMAPRYRSQPGDVYTLDGPQQVCRTSVGWFVVAVAPDLEVKYKPHGNREAGFSWLEDRGVCEEALLFIRDYRNNEPEHLASIGAKLCE